MNKYVQFILVVIYALVTITAVCLLYFLLGNKKLLDSDLIVSAIIAGWILICLSAVYWFTDIYLFFSQVRKPVYEEERRLILSLQQIQRKINDAKKYRFRIAEKNGINTFAVGYRTIVVSKDSFKFLTDNELSALLAHEIGHLRTRDTMASLAFYFANLLPGLVGRMKFAKIKSKGKMIASAASKGLLASIIVLITILFILSKTNTLLYILPVISFVVLLWIFNKIFIFLWLMNLRFTEYRQDEFVQKLGFGIELKQALLKIVETNSAGRVDQFTIITRGTHPIVYNRIRRLEKLEGLRK